VYDSQRWQELYGDPGFLRHVAVAKQLGLQILRISDAIVLPLNTTHYSYELESYLDKVEAIAQKLSLDVDLSRLRGSIRSLQYNSLKLDKEKIHAEKALKRLIRNWKHRHSRRMHFRKLVRKITCRISKYLGVKTARCVCQKHQVEGKKPGAAIVKPRKGRYFGWLKEQEELKQDRMSYGFPSREFIRAVERIRAVNQKLVAFERGFISDDGIPDREWYRHLGVAPGKWLGYGATTFPALTESMTIEKNASLASYEAGRLVYLIDELAKELRVRKK